ncbi:hypothetical protein, partial [Cellulomonas endophytica]|uniref:hypothetical protein n=1 Tax=Cellulomonas endophytica TaxID=2494735 RepID=UPI00196BB27D
MGFLDKAKAAANELAAKADTALASQGFGGPGGGLGAPGGGDAEKLFRDLGVLQYQEATGRPASAEERHRVMTALHELETRGVIRSFTLQTAPPPAPGAAAGGWGGTPAGAHGAPPPPGGAGGWGGHGEGGAAVPPPPGTASPVGAPPAP